ncbi:acetyl-CoA C-acetyltransferase [Sesbania bispinosa]|nr:acetyl-CoA C-acetyltransferase [Sesbania bispinosa]
MRASSCQGRGRQRPADQRCAAVQGGCWANARDGEELVLRCRSHEVVRHSLCDMAAVVTLPEGGGAHSDAASHGIGVCGSNDGD